MIAQGTLKEGTTMIRPLALLLQVTSWSAASPDMCLRMYFEWDLDIGQILVG